MGKRHRDAGGPRSGMEKVRKAAPPPPPTDDPIYKFLEEVYRLRCKVEKSPELQNAVRKEHSAHQAQILRNYARVIIELTAPTHVSVKMKHKYVAALDYAFNEGVEPKDFVDFIQEQGGLNKCVGLRNTKYGRAAKKTSAKKKPTK